MLQEIPEKLAIALYRKLQLCRRFEERVIELVNRNEIYGSTHEYIGEEAIAVGICANLRANDYVASTHRGHAHILCKGGDPKRMYAELMGRESGYNCGRGGSMHISDPALSLLGANGIVGAGVPIAVGAAFSIRRAMTDQIAVAFFGDGAMNQGVIHESMNMAAIWNLPVLFVCENNQYAVSTPITYSAKIGRLSDRARAYGFEGRTVDGMDVHAVYTNAKEIIDTVRAGGGPFLLECKAYRYHGHFTAEKMLDLHYRTEEEIESYKARCPVRTWRRRLLDEGMATEMQLDGIDAGIESEIEEAIEFARKSELPLPERALEGMYATPYEGIPQGGTKA
jgi:TPP-dependent pyruvate/acetoin dehydrogenase alpha subunit